MTDGGEMVKVESLVQEFLSAQSLKVLPQGPFGDAVNQFVSKDDKHAMELFVSEHLTGQVKQLLGLESDDEDLNSAMDIYRSRIEQQVASEPRRQRSEAKRVLKPKPETWDSDFDGNWEDEADAWAYEAPAQDATPNTTSLSPWQSSRGSGRGRNRQKNDDEMPDVDEDEGPASRTTTKPGAGKPKAAPKTAAKKPPAKKAPARSTRGRGRKAAGESEEADEEEEDVVMDSDEEPRSAPKPAPKPRRGQAAKPAPASRRQVPAAAATRASGRARQTTLDFSQGTATQALEISDDEISDDEDAFEPAPAATRTRRR